MKTSGRCPKCGSDKIAVIPSKFGTYNQIKIDLFKLTDLTRYICSECGYLEQYVESGKALGILRSKILPATDK